MKGLREVWLFVLAYAACTAAGAGLLLVTGAGAAAWRADGGSWLLSTGTVLAVFWAALIIRERRR